MNNLPIDISIVLNGHREGLLIYRSLRSLFQARRFAENHGLCLEMLVVLDRADNLTITTVNNHREIFSVDRIIQVDYANLGAARNEGIKEAKGKFVVTADADDLVSENWFYQAYLTAASESDDSIIHLEHIIYFDAMWHYQHLINQDDERFDPRQLLFICPWQSCVMARRKIFLTFPYITYPLNSGFGYEDWYWICETIAHGIKHKLAPGTVHFYRQKKEGSLVVRQNNLNTVIPPSQFFNDRLIFSVTDNDYKKAETSGQPSEKGLEGKLRLVSRRWLRPFYFRLNQRGRRLYNNILENIKGLFRKNRIKPVIDNNMVEVQWNVPTILKPANLPPWLIGVVKQASIIEPTLFPNQSFISRLTEVSPQLISEDVRNLYGRLQELWPEYHVYDHVFVLNHFNNGESERKILSIIEALSTVFHQKILLITTDKSQSDWILALPPEIQIIEYGRMTVGMRTLHRETILLRLFLQRQPKVINIVNSRLGWKIVADYGRALRNFSRLYASVFTEQKSVDGEETGLVHEYLPPAFPYLNGLFVDSRFLRNKILKTYGLPRDFIIVIYFPQKLENKNTVSLNNQTWRSKDILCRGQFDNPRSLNILKEVAKFLPDYTFWIYGRPVSDNILSNYYELEKLPNIHLFGEYTNIAEVLSREYRLFLQLPSFDGLPGSLIEAAAARLPVVAPDMNGINELINERTGWLASQPNNTFVYCQAILAVSINRDETQAKVQQAYILVKERHSWEGFVQRIKEIPNYLILNN